MGKVIAGFSMSLDGFVATPDDGVPHILDWDGNGTVRFHCRATGWLPT